jgi:hypothetical protein
MAVIIPFKARPRMDGAETRIAGSAQIFLFTGVRYERHDEAVPGPVIPRANNNGQPRRTRRRA